MSALGVARSSIPMLFFRSFLSLPLSSGHLFLASLSDRYFLYGGKMISGSPKPTMTLQCLFPREGGSIFVKMTVSAQRIPLIGLTWTHITSLE